MLRIVTIIAFAVLLAVGVGSSAGATTTFTDPNGDAGSGADITKIVVTSDASNVKFQMTIANRASTPAVDDAIYIYIDGDANASTGANGSDYRVYVFGGGGMGLQHWSGSSWDAAAGGTVTFSGGVNATVPGSLLGTKFDFFASSAFKGVQADYAPDTATSGQRYHFSKTAPPPVANDRDKDGVPDARDKCPTIPRGTYDSNHNGCPGPFGKVAPVLDVHGFNDNNVTTTFTQARIVNLPARSHVVLGGAAHATGTSTTSFVLAPIQKAKFKVGTTFTLRVTHPGWIGWVGTLTVTSHGLSTSHLRCIPATGGDPRACSGVSRGR